MTDDHDQIIRRNQREFGSYFPDGKRPADSTLGRWIAAGTFPEPDVRLSPRYVGWWSRTLKRWQRGEWKGDQ